MKSFASLLCLVAIASATPYSLFENNGQAPMVQSHPDFDFDLNELRLVQLEAYVEPVWMTELEKIHAKARGSKFFDITDTPDLGVLSKARLSTKGSLPSAPNASDLVKPVIGNLSTAGPRDNLAKFTSFRTRHYRSETGKQSQQWLVQTLADLTAEYAPASLRPFISITEFPHSWGQNSVIARINGTSADDDSIVIIGAHQDSTNLWPFLPAPGADDDGSGSMTILESYRALVAAGFQPIRPVEFHWYSAEEGGLLGSQAVAKAYEAMDANVLAMSQFDMTAWVRQNTREEVGIVTDFVDSDVTAFNTKLVDAYLDIPWVATKCGYACSDHASWSKAGYASAFTIESTFENSNKNIHSTNDRLDISPEFSFEHMLEFSKLAVAFAIELGGWSKAD